MNQPKKSDDALFEPGTVLAGKYRVERTIGSGGMGVVVAAMHLSLAQQVAIKVLRSDVDGRDEAVARFLREARAAARIQSQHVARVFDVSTLEDGTPYMVMEYLEGCDLRDLVLGGMEIPVADAVDYVLQACEALGEAHHNGVVHRDIKPSNLFLAKRANGTRMVKLLDFGISKVLASVDAGLTTTNSLVGSPLYMSPEQMRSSRDVDARADIWALGAILYELLAGTPPFLGETIPEVCVAVMGSQPEKLGSYRTDIPAGLEKVVLRCLEKDRNARYPNVQALAEDLQPFAPGASMSSMAGRGSQPLLAPYSPATYVVPSNGVREPELETQRTLAARVMNGDLVDSLPSFTTNHGRRGTARKVAWVAVPAVLVLGGFLAYAFRASDAPPTSPASADSHPVGATTSAPVVPPPPPVQEVAQPVPEPTGAAPAKAASLANHPVASGAAASGRKTAGAKASGRPPATPPTPPASEAPKAIVGPEAPVTSPAPSPPPSASPARPDPAHESSDAWKWGDRN